MTAQQIRRASETEERRTLLQPYRIVAATMPSVSYRLLILVAIALIPGCAERPPQEVRIGLLVATGADFDQTSGHPTRRGADLAIQEINAAGGIRIDGEPHMLRLFVESHEQRGESAASKARLLINRDRVHALVGPQTSATAIPVSKVADVARIPMISPMSSNAQTTSARDFAFRLAFLDDVQGTVLAQYAIEENGAQTAGVLFDEALAYANGLARKFRIAFENAGGEVVAYESYTTDAAETFTEQLSRIAIADPDVLFLPNITLVDSIQMVEARALGIRAAFIGSDSWDMQRLRQIPEAEGAVISHQWHYESPTTSVAAFLERFDAAYGRVPRTTAAMTYDAVGVLAEALRIAGTASSGPFRDAIRAVDDYEGVTGRIAFRGGHDPERSVVISVIEDGEIRVVGPVEPRSGT